MKMIITEIEHTNIRRMSSLKLKFIDSNGSLIKNSFVMTGNGTGKTTIMTLIKGLLDGTAANWQSDQVKSFQPSDKSIERGEFSITTKFNENQYKYFLILDYKNGTARIEHTAAPKGREPGRRFPGTLGDLFTTEFVRRFVFDGEQAQKSMNAESSEAEEAIKYLYRLDELDNILVLNQTILSQIQNTEGKAGTETSIKNLRTRKAALENRLVTLNARLRTLIQDTVKAETEKAQCESRRKEMDKKFEQLNTEKANIETQQENNRGEINTTITQIISSVKSPYLLNTEICSRMLALGNSMTKLKLPKTISKDFFTELSSAPNCVCNRPIGKIEKQAILDNSEKYLGSDQQSVLNTIKSSLVNCEYDESLCAAFNTLKELREEENRLLNKQQNVEEKLLKAGGEDARVLQDKIGELDRIIGGLEAEKRVIESKNDSDENLTEDNNIHKAELAIKGYETKIASATRTNSALNRKNIIEKLILDIKKQSFDSLKEEIIKKTNEKLRNVITDDIIEIASIDNYIKLKDKSGASEGQTLSIAYCFLGTLFEKSELEFPFVIDSPAGKMDFEKRRAVADVIPSLFNQLIALVTSAEVEQFADRFYSNPDSQYMTIIASNGNVELLEGKKHFDSYQRDHKGEE